MQIPEIEERRLSEKMKMLNRSVPLWAVILSFVAIASISAATIYFTLEVPSVVLVVSYEIELWNEGKTATVVSFNFGQMNPGESAYGPVVWVKNAGDAEIWYAWHCDDLPEGLQLIAEDSYDGVSWADWFQEGVDVWRGTGRSPGDGGILPGTFGTSMIRFKVTHTNTVSGTLSFTIKIDSANSATG